MTPKGETVADLAAKGGNARAEALSAERRSEIARKAVEARWHASLPQATHGSAERPLRIGEIEIPCYVLNDGRRVLVQSGMLIGLDMKQGTAGRGGGDRLAKFIATKSVNPFVKPELADLIIEPIKFKTPSGVIAYGYEATVLADLCDAVLEARKVGKLNYQQEHIAERCETLVRGFARVGIIALVDEATGFQDDRKKDELAQILQAYINEELRPWVHTFPNEFFKQIYRLNNWPYNPNSSKRNQQVGHWINRYIYNLLPPGVLQELRRRSPKNERGNRPHKLFQVLTADIGNEHLDRLLSTVTTLMRVSDDKRDFKDNIAKAFFPDSPRQQQLFEEKAD
jgi:hypothetical protein